MGRSSIYFVPLLYLLFFSSWVRVQSDGEAHISVEVSETGLDFFVKSLLMEQAQTKLVPLSLPDMEKYVQIPFLGNVHMGVSNMTLVSFHVASSTAKIGDTGIAVFVSDATATLSLNWDYAYSSWIAEFSDNGNASIQVEGMELGITVSLKNEQGSLKLSVLEGGCSIEDISINLEGGASWLYQGFINAFGSLITSTAEETISSKIKEGIESFNSVLQSFPKEFEVNSVAALNITFIGDPELSDSSLSLAINGLFSASNDTAALNVTFIGDPALSDSSLDLRSSLSCKGPARMLKVSVNERVLASAARVYFEAGKMRWIVNNVPEAPVLNTAAWKHILPQLYKQYPNDDMSLNVSAVSPPIIKFEETQIAMTVPLDVIITVLDGRDIIPVGCISMVISASASPEISSNAVAGTVKLKKFTMSQKWSDVGDLHVKLIENLISAVLRTVVLPFVNLKLSKGIPLPMLSGFGIQKADVVYGDSWIVVFSDLTRIVTLQPPFIHSLC